MIILYDKIIECRFACLAGIEHDTQKQTYYARVALLKKGVHIPIPLLDIQCSSYQEAEAAIREVFALEEDVS